MLNPKILKKTSTKKAQESGCCFTSCGGAPINQNVVNKKNRKDSKILQRIERI